jgi:tRNA(Ile)-lysidine synthase
MPLFSKNDKNYRLKNKVLRIVDHTITTYAMFQPGDSVLVGVSGGPDSVALYHILNELAPKFSLKLGIAHLNHSLRIRESDSDAEFVLSLANRYHSKFFTRRVDISEYKRKYKLSLEEAARQIRYNFYKKVAEREGFNKIAVGHQADDNAELVLMYLLRGSGASGISGIPPVREGQIVRPLIKLTRAEIVDYLATNGLKYVTDRSNTDPKFMRNRIRHQLLPTLKDAYNPNIIETLNRFAEIIQSEDEWMNAVIKPIFDDVLIRRDAENLTLSVPRLNRIQVAERRRVIRKAILAVKGDLKRITFSHIDATLKLTEKIRAYGHLDLPTGLRVRRKGTAVCFTKEEGALPDIGLKSDIAQRFAFKYSVPEPRIRSVSITIKEAGTRLKFSKIKAANISNIHCTGQQVAYFDMDNLSFPLILRNFRPGDRFTPLGLNGTQKVKKYFINQKVPRPDRTSCPLLLNEDKIIWIVGHRIDESSKVKASTRNVLKAELFLAD